MQQEDDNGKFISERCEKAGNFTDCVGSNGYGTTIVWEVWLCKNGRWNGADIVSKIYL